MNVYRGFCALTRSLATFERGRHRLGRAQTEGLREGPLPRLAHGLDAEAVVARLAQTLHPEGVARPAVDRHEPETTSRVTKT